MGVLDDLVELSLGVAAIAALGVFAIIVLLVVVGVVLFIATEVYECIVDILG